MDMEPKDATRLDVLGTRLLFLLRQSSAKVAELKELVAKETELLGKCTLQTITPVLQRQTNVTQNVSKCMALLGQTSGGSGGGSNGRVRSLTVTMRRQSANTSQSSHDLQELQNEASPPCLPSSNSKSILRHRRCGSLDRLHSPLLPSVEVPHTLGKPTQNPGSEDIRLPCNSTWIAHKAQRHQRFSHEGDAGPHVPPPPPLPPPPLPSMFTGRFPIHQNGGTHYAYDGPRYETIKTWDGIRERDNFVASDHYQRGEGNAIVWVSPRHSPSPSFQSKNIFPEISTASSVRFQNEVTKPFDTEDVEKYSMKRGNSRQSQTILVESCHVSPSNHSESSNSSRRGDNESQVNDGSRRITQIPYVFPDDFRQRRVGYNTIPPELPPRRKVSDVEDEDENYNGTWGPVNPTIV